MSTYISIPKLIEAMNDKPIAFNKHYVFIGCGINGALLLSQLVYWSSRSKNDGWIYKTHEEWTWETGLTRREQETARKTLKSLGFLTEKKKGVPCRLYFKVEHEKLYEALIEYAQSLDTTQLHNSAKLDAQNRHSSCTEAPNKLHNSAKLDAQNRHSITENTTENTTESVSASAPEKTETAKSEKTQKFSAMKFLLENKVTEQTAKEYLDLRAKKKKPVTDKVLKIVIHQAKHAQISNELAFQIITVRGWDSFNATWNWQETANQLETLHLDFSAEPQQPEQPKWTAEVMEW